jgi:hypothetical protein
VLQSYRDGVAYFVTAFVAFEGKIASFRKLGPSLPSRLTVFVQNTSSHVFLWVLSTSKSVLAGWKIKVLLLDRFRENVCGVPPQTAL